MFSVPSPVLLSLKLALTNWLMGTSPKSMFVWSTCRFGVRSALAAPDFSALAALPGQQSDNSQHANNRQAGPK